MTTTVLCCLMCFGTVTPAIWLGTWKRSGTNLGRLGLWVAAALAPVVPVVTLAQSPELLITIASAIVCAIGLVYWWVQYDACFRRILTGGSTIPFRRGSISGAALCLTYPVLIPALHHFPRTWGVVAGLVAFGFFLGLFVAWVKESYELVTSTETLKVLGDRPSMDRMIGASYTMYVGQAGSILVGVAAVFFDEVPIDWHSLGIAKWQTLFFFILGLTCLCFTHFRPTFLYPGLLAASSIALVSSVWLLLGDMPAPDWVSFLVTILAVFGLCDSVLSNGFWHHLRTPQTGVTLSLAMLAAACLTALYWIFGSLAENALRYGRDDIAALFGICALGWLYYLLTTFALARVSDLQVGRPIQTQNSPTFNLAHDSLIIVSTLLLGSVPVAWIARAGWPDASAVGPWEIVGIVLALWGAFTLVVMGIYAGKRHLDAERSKGAAPNDHLRRMIRQWGAVILLVVVAWIPLLYNWIRSM